MAKKIRRIKVVTKEELARKEETGSIKKTHEPKAKDYIPMDMDDYKKIAKLRKKTK